MSKPAGGLLNRVLHGSSQESEIEPSSSSEASTDDKFVYVKVFYASDPDGKPEEFKAIHCTPVEGFLQIVLQTYPVFEARFIPALQIQSVYVRRKVTKKSPPREAERQNGIRQAE